MRMGILAYEGLAWIFNMNRLRAAGRERSRMGSLTLVR